MTDPWMVHHVFPYDPRHLGQTFERWAPSQLERWPLVALAHSRHADRCAVHVIGPRRRRIPAPPLEIVEHPSLTSGPRYRDWGDDWSLSLQMTLMRLNPQDVCVIHLNDYAAARLAQRAARRSRVVIVFHGRGLGTFDEHLNAADRLVVLREDAAEQLRAQGAPFERVAVLPPSVDRARFFPGADIRNAGSPVRLGFVGRLERSKGVLEIPPLLASLQREGIDARAELVGPADAEQRAQLGEAGARAGVNDRIELVGSLPGAALARRMRQWRLFLLPSYTEGHPLVALEACACRLPVAAVEGVLPAELEARPCVDVAPREGYADLVLRLLGEERPPPADWLRSHHAAAAEWDALLAGLPAWRARAGPAASRLRRARRLRPPRRLARALLRRRG